MGMPIDSTNNLSGFAIKSANRSMSATWDVQRQRCNVGPKKAAVLLDMWNREHPENASTVLTVHMLLHLLLEHSDEEVLEQLYEAKVAGFELPKAGTKAKLTRTERMAQIRQAVLLRADDLGVISDLGKTSESDTYSFCAGLPLTLAEIFGRLVDVPSSEGMTDELTDGEDDVLPEEDSGGVGKDWRELIRVLSVQETRRGRRVWSLVFNYFRQVSNKFAHQDRTSDAALYLVLLLQLLREFRARAENGTLELVQTNGPQHMVIGWLPADEALRRVIEEDIKRLIDMIESRIDVEWDYVTILKSVKSTHNPTADLLSSMMSKASITAA